MSACTIPGPDLTSFSSVRAERRLLQGSVKAVEIFLLVRSGIAFPLSSVVVKKFILENRMFSESNLSS